jgi:endonuclease III
VKNAAVAAKKFTALLKKIGRVDPPPPAWRLGSADEGAAPEGDATAAHDPIATLVMSFLMWESTTDRAQTAYQHIRNSVVDFNELRVCMPHETVEIIGQRYPLALNRAQRLRAAMRNIYLREHAMNLDKHASGGKRDLRKYIESLEGMVPYVANRTLLLCFETHVLPVDEQLRTALIEAEVADASVEVPELATWLAMHVKAPEILNVHAALQKWMDSKAVAAERRSQRKPARGKAARR